VGLVPGTQKEIFLLQTIHCLRHDTDYLGNVVYLLRLERSASHVDVVRKVLDGKNVNKNGPSNQEKGARNGYDDTWTAQRIPYIVVL
jgi:hypothetical protein